MLGSVIVMLAFGLVMLASASRVRAAVRFNDPYYFIIRQSIWLLVSMLATFVVVRIDYHWYKKLAWVLLAMAVIGLCLVFVPGIGVARGGSARWIDLFGMRFQPSEFAKFAMIAALTAWYTARPLKTQTFWVGAALPFGAIGFLALLLFLEPDYGTAALIVATGVGIMFVAGVRLAHLGFFSLLGVCAFLLAIMQDEHRLARTIAFLAPERYPSLSYQLGQSKDAFSLGGWFGVGLGNSIQKHFYLPEAHTDFILAIIGEELGLLATGSVVLLFLVIFICCLQISARAPDRYGRLLGFGIAMMLLLQAAINVAVVTGCMPTKGITLPFISYGGSSLLLSMSLIGVMINISRHAGTDYADRHTDFIRNHELTVADG